MVALDERRFDTSLCGKQIRVITSAGRRVDVIVAGSTKAIIKCGAVIDFSQRVEQHALSLVI